MLHDNIRSRARRLGLRNIDIARGMDVAKSTVTNWLNGTVPRQHHLEALARLLKTSVARLYADRAS